MAIVMHASDAASWMEAEFERLPVDMRLRAKTMPCDLDDSYYPLTKLDAERVGWFESDDRYWNHVLVEKWVGSEWCPFLELKLLEYHTYREEEGNKYYIPDIISCRLFDIYNVV
jgi:hypothetical protein